METNYTRRKKIYGNNGFYNIILYRNKLQQEKECLWKTTHQKKKSFWKQTYHKKERLRNLYIPEERKYMETQNTKIKQVQQNKLYQIKEGFKTNYTRKKQVIENKCDQKKASVWTQKDCLLY